MKSLIALTAIAVFTVATAVAGKPGAFATDKAIAAAKSKPVMMAEQQLPFDRAALEELIGDFLLGSQLPRIDAG